VKADRKRLKAEKYDLLNQMKQLYSTLEDKEKELRDFIRNYEQVHKRQYFFSKDARKNIYLGSEILFLFAIEAKTPSFNEHFRF
jgi:hypothetical protein